MKTEEQIKEEIKKHKDHIQHTNFENRSTEQKMHSAIIEALERVLKEEQDD